MRVREFGGGPHDAVMVVYRTVKCRSLCLVEGAEPSQP